MNRPLSDQVAWLGDNWNLFWFAPGRGACLAQARVLLCSLAAVWFLTVLMDAGWWFGETGWNASDVARRLSVATEGEWFSRFRISPLWSTSQVIVFQSWAGAGIVLAALCGLGVGGRVVAVALFLSVLGLVQRMTWATGAFEPALVAVLGYLAIDPGEAFVGKSRPAASPRWSATLTTRLLQVHGWLLVATALASQLANVTWWRGEAAWWLAATGRSNLLSPTALGGHILSVNLLTHGITLCTLIATVALWPRRLRTIGVVCSCGLGIAYALVADQMLYGLLIIALTLSVFGRDDC